MHSESTERARGKCVCDLRPIQAHNELITVAVYD